MPGNVGRKTAVMSALKMRRNPEREGLLVDRPYVITAPLMGLLEQHKSLPVFVMAVMGNSKAGKSEILRALRASLQRAAGTGERVGDCEILEIEALRANLEADGFYPRGPQDDFVAGHKADVSCTAGVDVAAFRFSFRNCSDAGAGPAEPRKGLLLMLDCEGSNDSDHDAVDSAAVVALTTAALLRSRGVLLHCVESSTPLSSSLITNDLGLRLGCAIPFIKGSTEVAAGLPSLMGRLFIVKNKVPVATQQQPIDRRTMQNLVSRLRKVVLDVAQGCSSAERNSAAVATAMATHPCAEPNVFVLPFVDALQLLQVARRPPADAGGHFAGPAAAAGAQTIFSERLSELLGVMVKQWQQQCSDMTCGELLDFLLALVSSLNGRGPHDGPVPEPMPRPPLPRHTEEIIEDRARVARRAISEFVAERPPFRPDASGAVVTPLSAMRRLPKGLFPDECMPTGSSEPDELGERVHAFLLAALLGRLPARPRSVREEDDYGARLLKEFGGRVSAAVVAENERHGRRWRADRAVPFAAAAAGGAVTVAACAVAMPVMAGAAASVGASLSAAGANVAAVVGSGSAHLARALAWRQWGERMLGEHGSKLAAFGLSLLAGLGGRGLYIELLLAAALLAVFFSGRWGAAPPVSLHCPPVACHCSL